MLARAAACDDGDADPPAHGVVVVPVCSSKRPTTITTVVPCSALVPPSGILREHAAVEVLGVDDLLDRLHFEA